jgi:hypothetical protein
VKTGRSPASEQAYRPNPTAVSKASCGVEEIAGQVVAVTMEMPPIITNAKMTNSHISALNRVVCEVSRSMLSSTFRQALRAGVGPIDFGRPQFRLMRFHLQAAVTRPTPFGRSICWNHGGNTDCAYLSIALGSAIFFVTGLEVLDAISPAQIDDLWLVGRSCLCVDAADVQADSRCRNTQPRSNGPILETVSDQP